MPAQNSILPPPLPTKMKQLATRPPLAEEMDEYRRSDSGSPGGHQAGNAPLTGSAAASSSFIGTGCSSLSSQTVFVAASAPRPGPLSTVQPAPRNDHVVTIRINPDAVKLDNDSDHSDNNSKISINQSEPINTIGKFIVNICESVERPSDTNPNGFIRISVNTKHEEMVQKTDTLLKTNGDNMNTPYFFCTSFPCSPSNTLMSSGQCSPSDTLDSGTCSDLDGTPPPLPKKKSSKSNGVGSHKRVSVTVIGTTAHNRAPSVTSSGAEVDSEDSESNISCDSLNSSDLSSASLHEDVAAVAYKTPIDNGDNAIPIAPKMPTLISENGASSGFLPQGLLKDIRDRSAKLSSVQEQTKTSWANLEKTEEVVKPEYVPEENLTSFKLVSKVNGENNKKPIIIETIPAYPKLAPVVNESTYEDRQIQQERIKQEKRTSKLLYDTDIYYDFHLNENVFENTSVDKKKSSVVSLNGFKCASDSGFNDNDPEECFAGIRDYDGQDPQSTIRSAKGTIRGVKNRVRAGIKTFLQMQDTTAKSYREKDAGKVVVYTTSMGIVRGTYQKCLQVKKILRTLLVKFEERDVFMSGEYQEEIKERMRSSDILVPQIYVDGQHVGDAETVERLNESGELRRMLKPYKSADACNTCRVCGGYRLLPCQVCSGSKKSVHRNHFTAEFVALKCMNCDEVGLVKCDAC